MEYQGNQNNHHMPLVYIILGAVFFTVIVIAVSAILGYQVNIGKTKIDLVGRLQLNITPGDSKVIIDGKELSWLDNESVSLTEGKHAVEIKRDGYKTWQDQVQVSGGHVKWLNVRLLASGITSEIVKNYPTLLASDEADFHDFMINHLTKNEFELVDLTATEPKYITLKLTDFYPNAEQYDFNFLRWNLQNDSLLFQDQNSPDKRTILINYKKPKITVDLTERYKNPQLSFQDFEITGANHSYVWLLEAEKLYRVNLAAADVPAELIAERVLQYSVIDENKVAFIQSSSDETTPYKQINIYNYKELRTSLVDQLAVDTDIDLEVGRLDLKDYLIYKKDNHLMIFQADNEFYNLKSPELDEDNKSLVYQDFLLLNSNVKMIYSKYFDQSKNIKLVKHNNDQYVMIATRAQNDTDQQTVTAGIEWFVYDINNDESAQFAENNLRELDSVYANWLDSSILWGKSQDGSLEIRYFNGRNQLILDKITAKYGVRFDKSQKNLYYIADNKTAGFDLMRARVAK